MGGQGLLHTCFSWLRGPLLCTSAHLSFVALMILVPASLQPGRGSSWALGQRPGCERWLRLSPAETQAGDSLVPCSRSVNGSQQLCPL